MNEILYFLIIVFFLTIVTATVIVFYDETSSKINHARNPHAAKRSDGKETENSRSISSDISNALSVVGTASLGFMLHQEGLIVTGLLAGGLSVVLAALNIAHRKTESDKS